MEEVGVEDMISMNAVGGFGVFGSMLVGEER